MVLKALSRMSILSLLLLSSHEPMATNAMDIVDETTHEKVFSSPDGAESAEQGESLGDQMADAIDDDLEPAEEQPQDAVVSVVDGKEKEGDYVEESDTPDGRHIRKEVHQGPGFKTVRITSNGGSGGPMMGGGGPGLMQAMMQDMMKQMAGQIAQREQPKKVDVKEKVIEMNGPMGRVVMRKRIPFDEDEHDKDDDHEEEGGIPPEILQMIRMTEAMHRRAGGGIIASPFGQPTHRQLQLKKDDKEEEDNTPRHEESHEDIMARMNKLSEEIGERHDDDKLMRLQEKKSSRSLQVLIAVGVLMLIVLISFVASCLGGKAKKDEGEDVDEHQYNSSKRVGKAD